MKFSFPLDLFVISKNFVGQNESKEFNVSGLGIMVFPGSESKGLSFLLSLFFFFLLLSKYSFFFFHGLLPYFDHKTSK